MSDRSALKSIAGTSAFGQFSRQGTRVLLPFRALSTIAACFDLILIVAVSLLAGMAYHLAVFSRMGEIETFFGVGALTAVNFSAILAARGAYQPEHLGNIGKQLRETTNAWLLVFFLLSLVAFSLKISETYSRGTTLSFFAAGWLAIAAWRFAFSSYITRSIAEGGFAEQKTIVLAEKGQLEGSNVVAELRRYGYQPVRTFELTPLELAGREPSAVDSPSQLVHLATEILELSRTHRIECVFLLISWDNRIAVERLMAFLGVLSVPVYLLPDRNVAHFLDKRITNIGTTWSAELKRAPLTSGEQATKRAVDILLASLVLVMLAPLMALVALVIKLESRGPALFIQTRNGFNGRPFKIYKFRTMSVLEDGPVIRQATKNDPRVTPLGRLLRRTNIDELPQVFNVLAGHMSLVGPRPHAAAHNSEYERIIANYAYRYHVKPGLTGWAQIHGLRGETQTVDLMARRVEFDLWYINNWSLWLDFKILLRTVLLGLQSTAY
jgi:Undecaprenyl-phosphate glucose phosphotransferase